MNKAIKTFKNHINDLEHMVLIFDEYSMIKTRDVTTKAILELKEAILKFKSIQKENTRLKKQLANNHHVECMCSFCKPVGENNTNINKAIITLNNALYFRDNSDYQTALFDALSELTGIKYDDFPDEFMEEK